MSPQPELTRIREEYSRRERELPAGRYSWNRPENIYRDQGIARSCIRALAAAGLFPLQGLRIADVGCGSGSWLLEFIQWGAQPELLAGIDLQAERVAAARRRIPRADLRAGSADRLPWPDASFDLVSQFMLFTSVLDPDLKHTIAAEILRVLKPGGILLWYDFRYDNPRNPHVRGIEADEIRLLFAPCPVRLTKTTLAPPLARLVVPWSLPLALFLERIPPLRTHYVGVCSKLPALAR